MTDTNEPLVLVGSYATEHEPGIHVLGFDAAEGELAPRGSAAGVLNPSYVLPHPNGRWVYSVSETSQKGEGTPGAVWAWRRDEAGTLERMNQQPSGGDLPCHLTTDATGRWLFAANYGSGSASVLPIREDGSLGVMTDRVQHHGSGPNRERQEGPHAHSTTMTPDNRFAIVADLGTDRLMLYEFDASRGKLELHAQVAAHPGAGPRHLAFHPNGRVVYAVNELVSTLTVYAYDAVRGSLQELATLDTLPPDAPENLAADVHVSAVGDRVYVSNRGHNSIAVFAAGNDGQLNRLALRACGGNWPRSFALAPGGQFMLVANQYSGSVSVLPLTRGGDQVGAPVASAAVPHASSVQFLMRHE